MPPSRFTALLADLAHPTRGCHRRVVTIRARDLYAEGMTYYASDCLDIFTDITERRLSCFPSANATTRSHPPSWAFVRNPPLDASRLGSPLSEPRCLEGDQAC